MLGSHTNETSSSSFCWACYMLIFLLLTPSRACLLFLFPLSCPLLLVPESFSTKCFGIQSNLNLLPPAFFFPCWLFCFAGWLEGFVRSCYKDDKSSSRRHREEMLKGQLPPYASLTQSKLCHVWWLKTSHRKLSQKIKIKKKNARYLNIYYKNDIYTYMYLMYL